MYFYFFSFNKFSYDRQMINELWNIDTIEMSNFIIIHMVSFGILILLRCQNL